MNEMPRKPLKHMPVTHFAEQVHITDPHKAGVKYSIYSTPYTRSVDDLKNFFIQTHDLGQYLKKEPGDDFMKRRYYFIACHALELWPWIYDDDIAVVVKRASEQVLRHYHGPIKRMASYARKLATSALW